METLYLDPACDWTKLTFKKQQDSINEIFMFQKTQYSGTQP